MAELHLGKKIQYLRAIRGWNDEELADRVGLNRVSIGRIIRGQQRPSLESLERFAAVLGVEIAELFTTPGATLPDPDDPKARLVDELIRRVVQLPIEVLHSLNHHVRTLLTSSALDNDICRQH